MDAVAVAGCFRGKTVLVTGSTGFLGKCTPAGARTGRSLRGAAYPVPGKVEIVGSSLVRRLPPSVLI